MEQEGDSPTEVEGENTSNEQESTQITTFTVRKCSLCHQPGHNKHTCSLLLYSITKAHLVGWKAF